jgi:hypothetical protein
MYYGGDDGDSVLVQIQRKQLKTYISYRDNELKTLIDKRLDTIRTSTFSIRKHIAKQQLDAYELYRDGELKDLIESRTSAISDASNAAAANKAASNAAAANKVASNAAAANKAASNAAAANKVASNAAAANKAASNAAAANNTKITELKNDYNKAAVTAHNSLYDILNNNNNEDIREIYKMTGGELDTQLVTNIKELMTTIVKQHSELMPLLDGLSKKQT